MSTPPPRNSPPATYDDQLRRLIILWGICCLSPIMYLAMAALIRAHLMRDGGWFPLEPFTWSRVMIGLGVWLVSLQVLHLAVRFYARRRLALLAADQDAFFRLLTRRTFILISLSETAIATGFCLFLLQGIYTPLLGGGIAAMLLYGQSHPRFGLPPVSIP